MRFVESSTSRNQPASGSCSGPGRARAVRYFDIEQLNCRPSPSVCWRPSSQLRGSPDLLMNRRAVGPQGHKRMSTDGRGTATSLAASAGSHTA